MSPEPLDTKSSVARTIQGSFEEVVTMLLKQQIEFAASRFSEPPLDIMYRCLGRAADDYVAERGD